MLNGTPEKVHELTVQTPEGVGTCKVPHSMMKRCHCGCDRFRQEFYVGWGRISQVIGAQAQQVAIPLFVCVKCGEELLASHPTVGQPPVLAGGG